MGQKQFLNLEFSWGRWNGDDIKDMLEPLQIVATRLGALNGFAKIMGHPLSLADHKHEDTESVSEAQSDASGTAVDDTFLLRQFRERNLAAEEEHGVRLIDVLPNIRDATTELRAAGVATLASIQALIVAVNTHRYKRGNAIQSARLAELDTSLTALRTAIADFKADRRFILLQPYQAVFEKHDAGAVNRIPLRALYQSYVFASNLTVVCTGIVQLAELASQTAAKRTRARLWAPKGLRAIVKLVRTPNGPGEGAVGEDVQPEQAVEAEERRDYSQCDPASLKKPRLNSCYQSSIQTAERLRTSCSGLPGSSTRCSDGRRPQRHWYVGSWKPWMLPADDDAVCFPLRCYHHRPLVAVCNQVQRS